MQIFWHGYTCVRIESKTGETECTLLTDPYENEASLRFPRTVEPDVLVLSHQDRKRFNIEGAQGHPFIVSDPGEYEVKGMFVNGIQDRNADEGILRPVIYRFVSEGMSIAFLGSIKRQLSALELEGLQNIDILLLPVGGGEFMSAKTAAETIATIEPRIVVPLSYDIPGIKEKLGSVDAFCKQLGACQRENANRLKIAKKDLPADNLLITVLERV
jgi:L-ascorbate metabolism protein UlaG (beta-lactamase superfamily)